MGNGVPTKVWVFQKGNGQLRVHPSPVLLRVGEVFRIRNLAQADAMAVFPEGTVVGPEGVRVSIGRSYSPDLTVVAKEPRYFEYDVTLEGGFYAEGGSKPGGIVDP